MPDTKIDAYSDEWGVDDEGAVKTVSPGESLRREALGKLANESLDLVNESIRARNVSQFSTDIKRAFTLYNASGVTATDLTTDWEGTRTAMDSGSKVVQNIIRQITNDGASQLGDMLYPTDQKNYGVLPLYPAKPPLSIINDAAVDAKGEPILDGAGQPVTHLLKWEADKAAMEHRVVRMAQKIENVLGRNNFGRIGRKLIRDGAITGTAVLRGVYVDYTKNKRWVNPDKSDKWQLNAEKTKQASYSRISVLDFLPDMSAEDLESAAYINVREWMLARQLRDLLSSGKYEDYAVQRLLTQQPRHTGAATDEGDVERLSVKDVTLVEDMYSKRYEVFETWADFDVETLREAGVKNIPEAAVGKLMACVLHCEGLVLKVYLNPAESGDMPFSVWCWEDDPLSIFGKGVPVLCENSQLIYNAVWRMILDHGGLAAVPMVGMVQDMITPATGDSTDYSLKGGKVWKLKKDLFGMETAGKNPFEVYEIPIHLDQFFAIMEKAEEDAYKLSGVTRIEKNQQGVDNAPVTLGATQIFQNNASVARRRQVRDFDDRITKTAITRLYDWLMEFEEDSDIKAPMEIEPRGSSVLMQREVNTQNLMQLYALTANGSTPGSKGVAMLREIQTGMQFPDGRFIEASHETEAREKAELENPPIDPEIQLESEKVAAQRELNEATIEINLMKVDVLSAEAQATAELTQIRDQREHYREMLKLELLTEKQGNEQMMALQKREDDVTVHLNTKLSQIKTQRDIAASKSFQDEDKNSAEGVAKLITAEAKRDEIAIKGEELRNKVAGTITAGV